MSNKLVRRISSFDLLFYHIFIGAKLTGENNATGEDGSSQRGELSLKESLLEILDCCLNHEERVSDVESRCEENYQHIRSLLYNVWLQCNVPILL